MGAGLSPCLVSPLPLPPATGAAHGKVFLPSSPAPSLSSCSPRAHGRASLPPNPTALLAPPPLKKQPQGWGRGKHTRVSLACDERKGVSASSSALCRAAAAHLTGEGTVTTRERRGWDHLRSCRDARAPRAAVPGPPHLPRPPPQRQQQGEGHQHHQVPPRPPRPPAPEDHQEAAQAQGGQGGGWGRGFAPHPGCWGASWLAPTPSLVPVPRLSSTAW